MYAVLLNYTAALEEVDAALPEHVAWLERNYEQGHFLASGPRKPRTGGVIIARGLDRAKLDEILAGDPFAVRGVAEYEIVDFVAGKTAPELEALRETP